MSQLSGLVSLFFIAAALITSWYDEPPRPGSDVVFPTLQLADN